MGLGERGGVDAGEGGGECQFKLAGVIGPPWTSPLLLCSPPSTEDVAPSSATASTVVGLSSLRACSLLAPSSRLTTSEGDLTCRSWFRSVSTRAVKKTFGIFSVRLIDSENLSEKG